MKKPVEANKHLYDLFIRGNPESEALYDFELRKLRLIDELRDLRESAGLSQRELALKLGMTPTAIAKLEDIDSDDQTLEELRQVISEARVKLAANAMKKPDRKRRAKALDATKQKVELHS